MIYDPCGSVEPKTIKKSGAINITVEDNTDYSLTSVTSLNMIAANVNCHGFITFGSSVTAPVIDEAFIISGDDITEAAASEVWEFSVYTHNGKAYIIFKNWSA